MNVLQRIERANYLASASDVEHLAGIRFESASAQDRAQSAYFRILLANAQKTIAGKPTLRARKGPAATLEPDEIEQHLAVFEEVNQTFYGAVLKGTPPTDDALERNRRTNFARTAASAIRTYIRGGGDLTRVSVLKATKRQLQTLGTSPATPQASAAKASQRLLSQLEALGTTDAKNAREILSATLAGASELLGKLGGKTTTSPEKAMEEHRLLKTSNGIFYPVASLQ
jgi:hypothetical protein